MTDTLVFYKSVDFLAQPPGDRNAIWCKLYQDGQSSQDIADQYGVSRERVCQILRKANLIEHKKQRARLAAELMEQDRAEVRAKRLRDEEQILQFVRAGDSTATAAAKVGITQPIAHWICKKYGVKSKWGRWRDLTMRKERLTQLVEAGLSLNAAVKQASAEEGKSIGYLWVQHNCPELLKKNRPRLVVPEIAALPAAKVADQVLEQSATAVSFPQLEWSEERITRLLALWFSGCSAQQVADIFGDCSRNAVIGQVYRLRTAGKLRPVA